MNAFSILFADSYDYNNSETNVLANNRTLASIPFGGRYRLVDFVLSALVGAGIYDVGIVTRNKYNSLMEHVGWGKDWDLNRKNGGLKFLTPFQSGTGVVTNKIEALNSVIDYIETALPEYCLLSDANIVTNIDLKQFMKYHEEKGADISFVYKRMSVEDPELQVTLDNEGRLVDAILRKKGETSEENLFLNMILLKKELLINLIEKGMTYGWQSIKKNIIANSFNEYKIYGFEATGYTTQIKTCEEFYQANMDLLKKDVRFELFHGVNPILTRIKDSVPTMYGENANVTNSLVADGCKIDGTVENCIIFRDVVVKKDAVVKNSIIMQGTVIENSAEVQCVITDTDVLITEGKKLMGTETMPFMINKGKVI
ncbi:MAG: glucose-1-phosphate adenylyltransferase subunit GlgD [Ruminococcaceae bacterium]|nr:glucose-1-phosphate adenylyltransferase subunit GlgD [Oscillospiraceae bacterium]